MAPPSSCFGGEGCLHELRSRRVPLTLDSRFAQISTSPPKLGEVIRVRGDRLKTIMHQFFAFFAASCPAIRPNTLPMVMPMPAA